MTLLAGQILRAADFNDAITTIEAASAQGLIGITEENTDQLVANTSGLFIVGSMSFNVPNLGSRRVEVSWVGNIASAVDADTIAITIHPGAIGSTSPIARARSTVAAANGSDSSSCSRVVTLAPGSYTYELAASLLFGTGPGGYIADANNVATFKAVDLGPA